ncbi:MAG: hypothetical protein AAFP77_19270 [Bacteroidota bacterium]
MKYYPLIFITLLALAFSSCKKDIDIEPAMPLPDDQPFFVSGEFYDTYDTTVRTFAMDMQRDEEDHVLPGITSTTGANDNHTYALSVMSFNSKVWSRDAPFSNEVDDPFLNRPYRLVGVRFVSDRPASAYDQPFTKEELEDLLQPGSYSLGTAPGQVEISAVRPNEDLRMIDPIPLWENSYNQLEILAVEDFEYQGAVDEEPVMGKLVHLRGQGAIKYPLSGENRTYYLKLEGKFLYTYE